MNVSNIAFLNNVKAMQLRMNILEMSNLYVLMNS